MVYREVSVIEVREALRALRPLFPGLDAAVARTADLLAAESAGTQRSDLRREVRAVLAAQESLRDIDFEHVEAAVRTIERGGSGRFHMKKGVELRIEQGAIVAGDEVRAGLAKVISLAGFTPHARA